MIAVMHRIGTERKCGYCDLGNSIGEIGTEAGVPSPSAQNAKALSSMAVFTDV